MKILITAATPFELEKIQAIWPQGQYQSVFNLQYFTSGVGSILSTHALTLLLSKKSYDFILHVGVAGAIDQNLKLGQVVEVIQDQFGDLGVEEKDGSFISIFEMGLIDNKQNIFKDGQLESPSDFKFLPKVTASTVNKVTGSEESIKKLKENNPAQIETMEGAAITYVSKSFNTNCLQIRAISNYVEPRNRDNWKIDEALTKLAEVVNQILSTFPGALESKSAKLKLGL